MSQAIRDSVMQQGILSDAAYAGNLVRDLVAPQHQPFGSVVSFGMVPYLSLFVHESYRKLVTTNPTLADSLSDAVKVIVTRSRHSLKLFEDNQRWVGGQVAHFRDEILPAHARYFLDRPPLGLGRRFGTDLGIYSYNAEPIATTHSATFHLGVEPAELFEQMGPRLRAIYEEYGHYFRRLGARLDTDDDTFVRHLNPRSFNERPDDVRADKYYPTTFDGRANTDLNVLLTVFRCMMNFVSSVIVAGAKEGEVDYTVFKIRFLTLYQVLRSLEILRDDRSYNLSNRAIGLIGKIVDNPKAQLILGSAVKPFRNTLMHYDLDSRVDTAKIDFDQPLFGLVPIYFPAHDAATFSAVVDSRITSVAAAMNEWAQR